ncbi:MAG: double zinc ribbon domain-containing protein [Oscillospiraceae bacterium]
MSKIFKFFKRSFNTILNLVYLPKCIFCGEIMEPCTETLICENCENKIPKCSKFECCQKCGKPLYSTDNEDICDECTGKVSQYFSRIVSVFEYEGKVRSSIIRYKSSSLTGYGREYARYMTDVIKEEYKNVKFDFIIATPPSKKRMREKGFDQIDFIAKEISKQTKIKYLKNSIKQIAPREKQSDLTYLERISNVKDNFQVLKPKILNNATVLLVDDVCTTCSTINECSKILKDSRVNQIYAVTFATTQYADDGV